MSDNDQTTGDWEGLLKRKLGEIKEPQLIPTGPWVIQLVGSSFRDGTDNMPPQYSIGVTLVAPTEEVDPDKLAENNGEWKGTRLWARFRLETAKDIFELTKVLTGVFGVDASDTDLDVLLKDKKLLRGRRAIAMVGVNSYDSKKLGRKVTESEVSSFQPLE